jgi:CcmD family protein
MNELAWLFVAFLVVWIGIGAYVLSIGIRQRALERRLDSLEERPHASERVETR